MNLSLNYLSTWTQSDSQSWQTWIDTLKKTNRKWITKRYQRWDQRFSTWRREPPSLCMIVLKTQWSKTRSKLWCIQKDCKIWKEQAREVVVSIDVMMDPFQGRIMISCSRTNSSTLTMLSRSQMRLNLNSRLWQLTSSKLSSCIKRMRP